MENLIACTLLYLVLVGLILSQQDTSEVKQHRAVKPNPGNAARPYSVMDISCIFNEEDTGKPLGQLTVRELRALAKKQNIRQPYKLTKAELVDVLRAS